MTKPKKKYASNEERIAFYDAIERGELSLAEALKRMRKMIGMTQAEYAKFVGVAPRIVIDLERGVGNPTLKSLEKIGHPYRLKLGFTGTESK